MAHVVFCANSGPSPERECFIVAILMLCPPLAFVCTACLHYPTMSQYTSNSAIINTASSLIALPQCIAQWYFISAQLLYQYCGVLLRLVQTPANQIKYRSLPAQTILIACLNELTVGRSLGTLNRNICLPC